MITYAIRIENRYFKEYVYADKNTKGRQGAHSQFGALIQEGDIIDVVTTEKPERTECKRSVGNTIACLCEIENLENLIIEIIPMRRFLKMRAIQVCKECGEPAQIDKEKSKDNWTVYKNTCDKCGGKTTTKIT